MIYIINKVLEDLENNLNSQDVQYYIFGLPEIEIGKDITNKGAVFVKPVSTDLEQIATGLIDQTTHTIEVILVKNMQMRVYRNADQETGEFWLTRVMDGREPDGSLKTNTIRYIVRNNLKKYGIRQPDISIVYNDDRIPGGENVTATMTITQEETSSQAI